MSTLAGDAEVLRQAADVLRRRLPHQNSFSAKLVIRLVEKTAEWCENGGQRKP
jgi:hypothetical protein